MTNELNGTFRGRRPKSLWPCVLLAFSAFMQMIDAAEQKLPNGNFTRRGHSMYTYCLNIDKKGQYDLQVVFGNSAPPLDRQIGTGKLVAKTEQLRLEPQVRLDGNKWGGGNICCVKWGERTYLIEDYELLSFCSAVRRKIEPKTIPNGSFFVNKGEEPWKLPVGDPVLPNGFPTKWLKTKLVAKATTTISEVEAILDMGGDEGIRLGTLLATQCENEHGEIILSEVLYLEKKSCIIRITAPSSAVTCRVGMDFSNDILPK